MKKTTIEVAEDLIDICRACVSFDDKKNDDKKKLVYQKFKSRLDPDWLLGKVLTKNSPYHKDMMGLIGCGADDSIKKDLLKMLGIAEGNFWLVKSDYLNVLVVPWLNHSITEKFRHITGFLKAKNISPYGNGHNWAKFLVAVADHSQMGVEKVIEFFHLDLYNQDKDTRASGSGKSLAAEALETFKEKEVSDEG